MKSYVYIVIDLTNDFKGLSYHLTQRSAYLEVAKRSKIPVTLKNLTEIGTKGGWNSEHGNFFVLEEPLVPTDYSFRKSYVYIITERRGDARLSYHKSQATAYLEVAERSKIPATMNHLNKIGSNGGWESEHGDFFVLEKDLIDNRHAAF